jgi:hypothetical protein
MNERDIRQKMELRSIAEFLKKVLPKASTRVSLLKQVLPTWYWTSCYVLSDNILRGIEHVTWCRTTRYVVSENMLRGKWQHFTWFRRTCYVISDKKLRAIGQHVVMRFRTY